MYDYQAERAGIFAEDRQRDFLRVRDNARRLLEVAGAFSMTKAWEGTSGDTWIRMAYVDRLVEFGEIREVTGPGVAVQDRVFVAAR